jgi:large subunit ribosomal protein L14
MIYPQTLLTVADNTGARKIMCIRVLGGNRKYAQIGDTIIGVVKEAIANMPVKQSDIVENTLKFLREEQSASLGMPLAFATGAGEATNRATLNNQQEILQLTLLDIQKRFLSTFNKFVMTTIAKAYKLPEVGVIRADKIGVDEKNDKSKRLIGYVEKGILTTQEVKAFAIKSEELQDREKVISLDN